MSPAERRVREFATLYRLIIAEYPPAALKAADRIRGVEAANGVEKELTLGDLDSVLQELEARGFSLAECRCAGDGE